MQVALITHQADRPFLGDHRHQVLRSHRPDRVFQLHHVHLSRLGILLDQDYQSNQVHPFDLRVDILQVHGYDCLLINDRKMALATQGRTDC